MTYDTLITDGKDFKLGHRQDPNTLTNVIKPGAYKLQFLRLENTYNFVATDLTESFPRKLDSQVYRDVFDYINRFLKPSSIEKYKKWNMPHRTGILLHGKPGTGKTCLVKTLVQSLTDQGFICLIDPPPAMVLNPLTHLRAVTKQSTPIIVIWEELETILEDNEPEILDLLDGLIQIQDIIVVATTNYIDKIPDRIKKRPSRFAMVREISAPVIDERIEYISLYLTDKGQILEIADKTEGFVLDQIKHILISMECLELSFEQAKEYAQASME